MDLDITYIISRCIGTIVIVAAPVLIVSMLVGLIVSIFQATTSIQDQTLTFVPKIMAIFGTLVVFGPWMLDTLVDRTTWLLGLIATVN